MFRLRLIERIPFLKIGCTGLLQRLEKKFAGGNAEMKIVGQQSISIFNFF